MTPFRVLSVAVSSGRVAYVYFEDGVLTDWALSETASTSTYKARKFAKDWIELLQPNVVITEKNTSASHKGENTQLLIRAIADEAAQHELHDIEVVRHQHYPNKYVEAQELAKRFPDIAHKLPKTRRLWDKEPVNTSYFEAIALALTVIEPKEGQ